MTSDASPDSRLSQSDDPILPARHGRPAKAGSKRESGLIFNFDKQIDFIRRRYAKRIIDREPSPSEEFGYISFGDAVSDISQLIDEIWVSLTPFRQMAYLLSLANLIVEFLPNFRPAPYPTFRVLNKMDLAFASLVQGRDPESGESLAQNGEVPVVSVTEQVRIRSLADNTRYWVIKTLSPPLDESADEMYGDFEETDFSNETDEENTDHKDNDEMEDVSALDKRQDAETGEARNYMDPDAEMGDEDEDEEFEDALLDLRGGDTKSGSDLEITLSGNVDAERAQLLTDISKVYERTLIAVGHTLGANQVGPV